VSPLSVQPLHFLSIPWHYLSYITQQSFANRESYIFEKHHSQQELGLTWTWELEKPQ
jgi:hypothetical protein